MQEEKGREDFQAASNGIPLASTTVKGFFNASALNASA